MEVEAPDKGLDDIELEGIELEDIGLAEVLLEGIAPKPDNDEDVVLGVDPKPEAELLVMLEAPDEEPEAGVLDELLGAKGLYGALPAVFVESGAGSGLLTVGSAGVGVVILDVEAKGDIVEELAELLVAPNADPTGSADGAGGTDVTLPIEPGTGAAGTSGSSIIEANGFWGADELELESLVPAAPEIAEPVSDALELALPVDVPPRP